MDGPLRPRERGTSIVGLGHNDRHGHGNGCGDKDGHGQGHDKGNDESAETKKENLSLGSSDTGTETKMKIVAMFIFKAARRHTCLLSP